MSDGQPEEIDVTDSVFPEADERLTPQQGTVQLAMHSYIERALT